MWIRRHGDRSRIAHMTPHHVRIRDTALCSCTAWQAAMASRTTAMWASSDASGCGRRVMKKSVSNSHQGCGALLLRALAGGDGVSDCDGVGYQRCVRQLQELLMALHMHIARNR